jgi:hypothetical protein
VVEANLRDLLPGAFTLDKSKVQSPKSKVKSE